MKNDKTINKDESTNLSLWHPEDTKWMSSRKTGWKKVQIRLSGATDSIHRSYWKNLKKYYFYGTPLEKPEHKFIDPMYIEFCRRWLHPTGEDMGRFYCSSYTDSVRSNFYKFVYDLKKPIAREGDTEYGVMGGREQQIMLVINPGFDHREKVDLGDGLRDSCMRPFDICQKCLGSTCFEIRSYILEPLRPENEIDYAYFAHGPGLVLWDHLSFAMEYDEREINTTRLTQAVDSNWKDMFTLNNLEENTNRTNKQFKDVLGQVLTFFDRDKDDESLKRHHTVKYVEYLMGRYEKKDFSDPLLKKWDMAKQSIKKV